MSIKLRDLIRSVRACKTAAEERAVITKECALIRTAIKEEDEKFRHRNVAKLMYIHMLGYPTHFGQMECLKLVSAQSFPEKRIGYLAITLLLNEQAEVLMLVTNSLKLDLSNSNQYIQALSLITIGNLATQDMARDLAADVEKLLRSSNPYLRKKAALATIRLIKKEPDLIEHMSERVFALLKDRSHGVLITGLQLMMDVLELAPEQAESYRTMVPSLVRLLRNFLSMGYSPEHDVGGITDPFMQVKLLKLLRLLGKRSEEASEMMNDVLAQVATNTESAKNAGNAILYECVQTIMDVESDSGLSVLAVNILGRFLLNRDNNIRYVALNSFSKVISEDISAVQRHRNIIVECLKDADISIRHRALELVYQLVNDQNVESLTAELLNYLVIVQPEHKSSLVSKLMTIVERFSPSHKWRIDTIVTMLSIAGEECDESVLHTSIVFIAQATELQGYGAHKIFRQLSEDTSQIGLVHLGVWCIGEYANLLLRQVSSNEVSYPALQDMDVVALLSKCLRMHNAEAATKALVLNALIKCTVHVSPAATSQIEALVAPFAKSMNAELQQRSTEYQMLLQPQWQPLRGEVLAKMPVIDEATLRKRRGEEDFNQLSPMKPSGSQDAFSVGPVSAAAPMGGGDSLLNIDDIFGGAPAPTAAAPAAMATTDSMLADIFTNNASVSAAPAPMAAAAPGNMLDDIFATPASAPVTPQPAAPVNFFPDAVPAAPVTSMAVNVTPTAAPVMPFVPPAAPAMETAINVIAFEKNGLSISMDLTKPDSHSAATTKVICKFSNATNQPLSNLSFQAAVPKYLKLEMFPPSATTIAPNSKDSVTQEIKVVNSAHGDKNLLMKLKISYSLNGKTVDDTAQVSNFPPKY